MFIDADDTLYAIDSESNPTRYPGWKTGIRIGSATEHRVTAFIPPHELEEDLRALPGKVWRSTPRTTCMWRKARAPVPTPGAD